MAQASSQSQQAAVGAAFDGWRKVAEDQLGRFGSMLEEVAKVEAASLEQAQTAVRELSRMTQESLAYAARLSAEWRKMALEAARGGSEIWKARA
ncbi:MAG TPA: hypothetical protein VMB50_01600 [Myxococcales bacterium]|nr:hypothetical protein [Myxococcales bacterium]